MNSPSTAPKLENMVCATMQHALVSMLVTSVTTSAAFFSSYISSITAIKCFRYFVNFKLKDLRLKLYFQYLCRAHYHLELRPDDNLGPCLDHFAPQAAGFKTIHKAAKFACTYGTNLLNINIGDLHNSKWHYKLF